MHCSGLAHGFPKIMHFLVPLGRTGVEIPYIGVLFGVSETASFFASQRIASSIFFDAPYFWHFPSFYTMQLEPPKCNRAGKSFFHGTNLLSNTEGGYPWKKIFPPPGIKVSQVPSLPRDCIASDRSSARWTCRTQ